MFVEIVEKFKTRDTFLEVKKWLLFFKMNWVIESPRK